MAEDANLSRRKLLKIAGGTLGIVLATCGGVTFLGTRTPSSVTYLEETCKSTNGKRTLIAYSSRSGATGEIGVAIANSLCDLGYATDLRLIKNINSLSGYEAVIIGSPVYMGKILNESVQFIEKFNGEIQKINSALYCVGLTMKQDTTENREKMMAYASSAVDLLNPSAVGLFAGRIDWDTLPPLYRVIAKADQDGILAEGDFRDWEAVSVWANDQSLLFQ